ncbi:UNVERIFIED_ORG: hypothetical protein B2H93_04570 [Clostridium botulinum]
METGTKTGVLDINGNELLVGDSVRVYGCTHRICEISYSDLDDKFIILIGGNLAQWFLDKDTIKKHSILKLNSNTQYFNEGNNLSRRLDFSKLNFSNRIISSEEALKDVEHFDFDKEILAGNKKL